MSVVRSIPSLHALPFGLVAEVVEAQLRALEQERRVLAREPMAREPLHRFRVTARRADAAVGMTQWALLPTKFARISALTSQVPRGTAPFRNADVQEVLLHDKLEAAPERERPALEMFAQAAAHERKAGRRRAVERAVARAGPARLRKPVARVLATADVAAVGEPLAFPGARVRLRGARLGPSPSEQDLHAFRLEMKAFRYALEAIADHPEAAAQCDVAAEAEEAREVTILLGAANDAAMLAESVARWRARLGRRRREDPGTQQAVAWLLEAGEMEGAQARDEFLQGWNDPRWPGLKRLLGILRDGAA